MQIRMEKVRLSSTDIKQIYFEAFPKKERMPFPMMMAMSKLWNTEFLGFYDGNTLCGFVYLAHNRKIVFVMFFAVDKLLRSKGYGSDILQNIQSKYPEKTPSYRVTGGLAIKELHRRQVLKQYLEARKIGFGKAALIHKAQMIKGTGRGRHI